MNILATYFFNFNILQKFFSNYNVNKKLKGWQLGNNSGKC